MGIHGHHTTRCKECDKVMETCRCMSKDKTIIYETCDACKIAVFEAQQEKNDEG